MTPGDHRSEDHPPTVAKVLLVDDRPANITALRAVLEPLGHECITASSGAEALKLVLRHDFAVILLDVMMPGLSGPETARFIRQRASSRNTPIIFISAGSMTRDDLIKAYAAGAVDYIAKPFEPAILQSKIAVFIDLYLQRVMIERQAARIAAHQYEVRMLAHEQKARLEAEQAAKRRDDLLATVSHDLRNPLTVIVTSVTSIRHVLRGPESDDALSALSRIERSAQRMDHLIGDLLDISAIDSGHLSMEPKAYRVDALCADSVEMVRAVADAKRIRLVVVHAAPHIEVLCDKERIGQVLVNIIGNATKFTPADGTINVATERRGELVRFTVTDTGVGIPADQLPHVFDRFWQATETAKAGTGLGLAIARGIVERHGGSITAESTPGAGTTFAFTVPIVTA